MDGFVSAFNHMMDDRDRILEDCRMARDLICDTKAIDTDLSTLHRELEVVAELPHMEIRRKAYSLEGQGESDGSDYLERYEQAKKQIEALERDRTDRIAKAKTIGRFMPPEYPTSYKVSKALINEFDERSWERWGRRTTR